LLDFPSEVVMSLWVQERAKKIIGHRHENFFFLVARCFTWRKTTRHDMFSLQILKFWVYCWAGEEGDSNVAKAQRRSPNSYIQSFMYVFQKSMGWRGSCLKTSHLAQRIFSSSFVVLQVSLLNKERKKGQNIAFLMWDFGELQLQQRTLEEWCNREGDESGDHRWFRHIIRVTPLSLRRKTGSESRHASFSHRFSSDFQRLPQIVCSNGNNK
jgi:hemolysin-activating ACP:hemolysin acyltransferase